MFNSSAFVHACLYCLKIIGWLRKFEISQGLLERSCFMKVSKRLLIHVGGARGAGKSLVLARMSQSVTVGLPLVVIPVSAFVIELGLERFGHGWDELTILEREDVRKAFIKHLQQLPQGIWVLDSHYIDILSGGTIRPIIPVELYPLVGCHVIIDCSRDILLARRKGDLAKRRSLNKRHVERERRSELSVARQIAKKTGTPFYTILNEQDPAYATERLGDIIKTLWQQNSHSSPEIPPKSN